MVGTQFHPEFRSRPDRPHPLFRDFLAAAIATRPGGTAEPAAGVVTTPAGGFAEEGSLLA
jgi:hypothetical protein